MTRARFVSPWAWPVALAALTGVGLVTALLADGAADWLSAAALATPLVVAAWHVIRAAR